MKLNFCPCDGENLTPFLSPLSNPCGNIVCREEDKHKKIGSFLAQSFFIQYAVARRGSIVRLQWHAKVTKSHRDKKQDNATLSSQTHRSLYWLTCLRLSMASSPTNSAVCYPVPAFYGISLLDLNVIASWWAPLEKVLVGFYRSG